MVCGMSYVVNVVGRKRVRDREELIRRALERGGLPAGNYTNKHTIYIDTSSNREEAYTTSQNTPAPHENDRTTYDINDLTPATVPTSEIAEEHAEGLGRTRTTLLNHADADAPRDPTIRNPAEVVELARAHFGEIADESRQEAPYAPPEPGHDPLVHLYTAKAQFFQGIRRRDQERRARKGLPPWIRLVDGGGDAA